MNKRTQIAILLLAALASLVAGCQQRPTAQEIVEQVKAVEASTKDAHAILEIQLSDPSRELAMVVEVWESDNRFRAELLESSSDEAAVGSIIVNDGQQMWIYDPAQNTVLVGDTGADQPAGPLNNPRDMVQIVDEAIQWVLDRSDVKLVGEEEVAGTLTYKLSFAPKEGQDLPFAAASEGTLWVDQERWIVLQARLAVEGVAESAMRVRSFELNPGIPDAVFTFDVPAGAAVQKAERPLPQHMTLDDARAMADSLLVPTYLPNGVTLIDVFRVEEAFVLHYNHSETTFTVIQGPSQVGERPEGRTSEVAVRGATGTLIADPGQGNHFLTWTEGGATYIIAGHIEVQDLLQVAESLQ
jgi:outer membrane lipoprotein-sorting protein